MNTERRQEFFDAFKSCAGKCKSEEEIHIERELACRAVREQVGVLGRFVPRHCRLIDCLQAPQPFHVRVAFPAWKKQAQRVALLGTDRLGYGRWIEAGAGPEECRRLIGRLSPAVLPVRRHVRAGFVRDRR